MQILLSYSKDHFDPKLPASKQKHWGSSANILARNLYEVLSTVGSVTYIDANEYKAVAGRSFDLLVGIERNFGLLVQKCKIQKSIFFAVNMHPKTRNELLNRFLVNNGLPKESLAGWDILDANDIEKSIHLADYIIAVGGFPVYNSYIKNGVPKHKIKLINYAVGPPEPMQAKKSDVTQLLYCVSEIGLRKGYDVIHDLFTSFGPKDKFRLNIVGKPTNKHYAQKLADLTSLDGHIVHHGWLDAASDKYQEIVSSSDYILLPSIEEGQTGSVLDALRWGVVPILSPNAGVEFSPLGMFELKLHSSKNKELLETAIGTSTEQKAGLRQKALEYYEEFHSLTFPSELEGTIKDALADHLYPLISVILPIFNKEGTIESLLVQLDQAIRVYQNCELHIIFDGCKDNSEAITRKALKDKPYKITYQVTPNIFEVKSNNLGLQKAAGKYCVIIQDDIYINDKNIFLEAITFLEKSPRAAVLGCLAGVNFYPRGTRGLIGQGQIAMDDNETYWRQDEKTDPTLKDKLFEVDACMRGPLIIRKSFLEKHGYLDEIYAPLYQDDMDLCFRAHSLNYKVYCGLFDVENRSHTVATYDKEKMLFWEKVMKKNTDTFYSRWQPTRVKGRYKWVYRFRIDEQKSTPALLSLIRSWTSPILKVAKKINAPA